MILNHVSPQPDNDLQMIPNDLPGMDIKKSFRDLGANSELLFRIAHEFIEYYSDSVKKIRTAIKEGDNETAARISHTLKGVSGILSAYALYDAALNLEKGIKQQQPEVPQRIHILDEELNIVLNSTRTLCDSIRSFMNEKQKTNDDSEEPDWSIIEDMTKQLVECMASNDPKSEQILTDLSRRLKRTSAYGIVREMELQIRGFDFKSAKENLKPLADALSKLNDKQES